MQIYLAATQSFDPRNCPLCGQANECQLCTAALYKGPCWCAKVKVPEELLARVPKEFKDKACICANCLAEFHEKKNEDEAAPQKIRPDDFYFDGGLMVFNSAYHLRRGYCCQSGCRHCPYAKSPRAS